MRPQQVSRLKAPAREREDNLGIPLAEKIKTYTIPPEFWTFSLLLIPTSFSAHREIEAAMYEFIFVFFLRANEI